MSNPTHTRFVGGPLDGKRVAIHFIFRASNGYVMETRQGDAQMYRLAQGLMVTRPFYRKSTVDGKVVFVWHELISEGMKSDA
jgi:hypothetical protein